MLLYVRKVPNASWSSVSGVLYNIHEAAVK